MTSSVESLQYNKTSEYFKTMYKLVYLCGWPNFWVTEPEVPAIVAKYHHLLSKFLNAIFVAFVMFEMASFFTQDDLTEKQISDRNLFTFSHPFYAMLWVPFWYYKHNFTAIVKSLAIDLKKDYNNEKAERQAIKKYRLTCTAFVILCSSTLISYGVDGVMQCRQTSKCNFSNFL